jgi:hypothetical protein
MKRSICKKVLGTVLAGSLLALHEHGGGFPGLLQAGKLRLDPEGVYGRAGGGKLHLMRAAVTIAAGVGGPVERAIRQGSQSQQRFQAGERSLGEAGTGQEGIGIRLADQLLQIRTQEKQPGPALVGSRVQHSAGLQEEG